MGHLDTAASAGVLVCVGDVSLPGDLVVPADACGIVAFAHGSGSSRHSPRNRLVAATLNRVGLATLLVDLLTPAEESLDRMTTAYRFDIALLARRLTGVVDWLARHAPTASLPVGLFGASTGAAAALVAAAERPALVGAVVSRGGRPDLAGPALARVHAPTLLIVGDADREVLELNRQALQALAASEKDLAIIAGATHLFGEAGALEDVAQLAADWLSGHLAAAGPVGG
jgi:dienelactone hydrolase